MNSLNCIFFFNYTATTGIYTYLHPLSLHDALPISDVNVFNMPFVFRDQAHMRKIIDGEIGQEILDKITNSEFNLVALAWMDGGTRNLYTKKPEIGRAHV